MPKSKRGFLLIDLEFPNDCAVYVGKDLPDKVTTNWLENEWDEYEGCKRLGIINLDDAAEVILPNTQVVVKWPTK